MKFQLYRVNRKTGEKTLHVDEKLSISESKKRVKEYNKKHWSVYMIYEMILTPEKKPRKPYTKREDEYSDYSDYGSITNIDYDVQSLFVEESSRFAPTSYIRNIKPKTWQDGYYDNDIFDFNFNTRRK